MKKKPQNIQRRKEEMRKRRSDEWWTSEKALVNGKEYAVSNMSRKQQKAMKQRLQAIN